MKKSTLFTLTFAFTFCLVTSQSYADSSCKAVGLKGDYQNQCSNCEVKITQEKTRYKVARLGRRIMNKKFLSAECLDKDNNKVKSGVEINSCSFLTVSTYGVLNCKK